MTSLVAISTLARLAWDLPAFLREPVTLARARKELQVRLETRGERLAQTVRRLIYEQPQSPYRRLLEWAGCEWGDLANSLRRDGLEATLRRLHEAGVRVTLEELKGRKPICRPGLTLPVRAEDFHNPFVQGRGISGATSGTSGARTRVPFDWNLMAEHAVNERLLWNALGLEGRSVVLWLPLPPSVAGLHSLALCAKCRWPVERWFSPTNPRAAKWWSRDRVAVGWLRACARWHGVGLPRPEYAPLNAAPQIARWVAEQGGRVMVRCYASLAVRLAGGAELPGVVFLTGGEPLTPVRRRAMEQAGARAYARYTATETGLIAGACADGCASDDMHVYEDRIAVISDEDQRLWFTSLSPHSGTVLLNADIGDCGELERRRCGCALGEAGLTLHVRRVRSGRRLNAEGMMVLAADLADEARALVIAAGGGAEDVQVEERVDDSGVAQVCIWISPRVTGVEEGDFLRQLRGRLGARSRGGQLASSVWEQAGTLVVRRGEPQMGLSGKTPVRRTVDDA